MPELIATLCTFLVLAPLALMPGMGRFLFRPMALAVAFAMICAYLLSRSLVPAFAALLLKPHGVGHGHEGHGEGEAGEGHHPAPRKQNLIARTFAAWEGVIESAIAKYVRALDRVMQHRVLTVACSFVLLAGVIVYFSPILRREFFPEVDAGAFQVSVRAPSGTRIENTEQLHPGSGRCDPRIYRRARPATCAVGNRADRRLVGRLHAQLRPDGCDHQDPVERASASFGPALRGPASRELPQGSAGSARCNLPSTPGAWSAGH